MKRLVLGLIAVVGLAAVAAGAAAVWTALDPRRSAIDDGSLDRLGDYGVVPDFALTERSGRPVTRAELLGAVWMANFIYTECTETCPAQSLQVRRLQDEFAGAKDLKLVSITVDPERDTAEVLRRYAERYSADPVRWLFLTGPKAAIYALAKDGFKLSVADAGGTSAPTERRSLLSPPAAFASHGSGGIIIHSSRFVLVDRRGGIRAYHRTDDPESLERLRGNVRALLAER
jgi:cytochrome oxidase Cu insertion factor (SCO1/SenC/PrrC family)